MTALHSQYNSGLEKVACGICIAPLRTNVPGPAPKLIAQDVDDIVDEALKYFRPNLLFKNYSVQGQSYKKILFKFKKRPSRCDFNISHSFYYPLFKINSQWVNYWKIWKKISLIYLRSNENDAKKKLLELSREAIPAPGKSFLGAQIKDAKDPGEQGFYDNYFIY